MLHRIIIAGASILILLCAGIYNLVTSDLMRLYNASRPTLLAGGGQACISALEERGATFVTLGNRGTDKCPILNAVSINRFKDTEPSSPFILSCPAALNLADWLYEAKIRSFVHQGTINCRKMRGSMLLSEHSFGTAIDISELDGAVVKSDWGEKTKEGGRLAYAALKACDHFSNVLTPNTNSAHSDHFHLDIGIGIGCASKVLK